MFRSIVRGVNVGVGHGSSVGVAKRKASVQALEYLRSYGTDDPILLQQMLGCLTPTPKFSDAGNVTGAQEHSGGARRNINTNQLRFVLSRMDSDRTEL